VFSTITLADGRTLEYAEFGDPDGIPVLYLHGTPGTAGCGAVIAGAAKAHGVRLLAPSRPGYGDTTPAPPGLTSAAADTLELADRLALDRFQVMGTSGGGPFALALAALAPQRVTSVAVLGGTGDHSQVGYDQLDEADRRIIGLLASGDVPGATAVAVSWCETNLAPLQGLSLEEFGSALDATTPAGESWFDGRPGLRAVFDADFQRGITSYDGFVRDNLSWLGSWDFDLVAVAAPVRLVYGESDQMVPRAHGEWLHERLSTSTLHVVPGGHGHATFGGAEDTLALLGRG
jgi:pimeloyl-ACP methyl ester carboxylesterase